MKVKKNIVYLTLLIGILVTTQVISGSAWFARTFPWSDNLNDVGRILHNELSYEYFDQPVIDIDTISSSTDLLQIKLSLSGIPVIDVNHGYRIMIGWTTEINGSYICDWENYMHWEEAIRPLANYSICVAGGISMFGVTNGSLTVFNNSANDPVYSELHNNTVTINENSLVFHVNHTSVVDPANPVGALIITTFNETIYIETSETFEAVTYADSLSIYYLAAIFGHNSLDFKVNTLVIVGLFGFVGIIIVIRRKRK